VRSVRFSMHCECVGGGRRRRLLMPPTSERANTGTHLTADF
jgi:hypothetical protein